MKFPAWIIFRERGLKNWRWWVTLPVILILAVIATINALIKSLLGLLEDGTWKVKFFVQKMNELAVEFAKKGWKGPIKEEDEYVEYIRQKQINRVRGLGRTISQDEKEI